MRKQIKNDIKFWEETEMNEEINKFRDGIFALHTRRFGKIAELMIQKIYEMKDSKKLAFDLLSKDNEKIEVKFSTVLRICGEKITSENLIEQAINSRLEKRMLTYDMVKKQNIQFDCNIQQIKTVEFDVLYYGCFFEDKIMIFKIDAQKIREDKEIRIF